jgi:hypothetical protein
MTEKIALEERLNDIISEKDDQISELESKIEALESRLDYSRWQWQQHEAFDNDEFSRQMPFPRLEMRMIRRSKDSWYSIEWIYGLVYKHYGDLYNNMLRFIPFSLTTSNGGHDTFERRLIDGKIDLPYRDGTHIRSESALLNLPAFIVCREKGMCQKIDPLNAELMSNVEKMRGK